MQVKRNDAGTTELACAPAAGPFLAEPDEAGPSAGPGLLVGPVENTVEVRLGAILTGVYPIYWLREWLTLSDEDVQASVLSCLAAGLLETISVSAFGAHTSAAETEQVTARIRQAFGLGELHPLPGDPNTLGVEVSA